MLTEHFTMKDKELSGGGRNTTKEKQKEKEKEETEEVVDRECYNGI